MSESICIVDFCGYDRTISQSVDFSADYWPKDKLVYFNGCWRGIPPMPAIKEPSEDEVNDWAFKNPNWYMKQRAAAIARRKKRNDTIDEIEKFYEEHGRNVIHCKIQVKDEIKEFKHNCGMMTWQSMLQTAGQYVRENGGKILYFKHYTGVKDVEKFLKKLVDKTQTSR